MILTRTITREVTQTEVRGYRCDNCGKDFSENQEMPQLHYWHNGWGNDSCDSHIYENVCSLSCLIERLNFLYNSELKDEYTAEYEVSFNNDFIEKNILKKDGD